MSWNQRQPSTCTASVRSGLQLAQRPLWLWYLAEARPRLTYAVALHMLEQACSQPHSTCSRVDKHGADVQCCALVVSIFAATLSMALGFGWRSHDMQHCSRAPS